MATDRELKYLLLVSPNSPEQGEQTVSLLPGLRKICLPVFKKNSAKSKKILHFFLTSIFKHPIGSKNVTMPLKEFHLGETCKKIVHKSWELLGKIHVFHQIFFFRPVFGRFWPKTAAVQPPIFLGQQFFSGAGFELFCRIFGRLAAVDSLSPNLGFHGHFSLNKVIMHNRSIYRFLYTDFSVLMVAITL
jgi:hypothetical protein